MSDHPTKIVYASITSKDIFTNYIKKEIRPFMRKLPILRRWLEIVSHGEQGFNPA